MSVEEAIERARAIGDIPAETDWIVRVLDCNLNKITIFRVRSLGVEIRVDDITVFISGTPPPQLSVEKQIAYMFKQLVEYVHTKRGCYQSSVGESHRLPQYIHLHLTPQIEIGDARLVTAKLHYQPWQEDVLLFKYLCNDKSLTADLGEYIWGASDVAV